MPLPFLYVNPLICYAYLANILMRYNFMNNFK